MKNRANTPTPMSQTRLIEQTKEFSNLWHQVYKLERETNLGEQFPEFSELSTNEITILDIVSKKPDVILKEIIAYLNLPKSTLTNTINRLEKKGYLIRVINKTDLRSYGLSLTTKGQTAQEQHKAYESVVFQQALLALDTEEERDTLLNLMNKIIGNIKIQ